MEPQGNVKRRSQSSSRRSLGSIQWMFQAATGAFIIFFLGVHLYVAHINGGSPIELFDTVVLNLRNPWWMIFFLLFLYFVTYHGLNGLKGILYEMGISARGRRVVAISLVIVFIASAIYGTLLSLIVASMAIP